MPERSNGTDSRSVSLVLTGVRILLPSWSWEIRTSVGLKILADSGLAGASMRNQSSFPHNNARVAQSGLERFPPKEEVVGSNPISGVFDLNQSQVVGG